MMPFPSHVESAMRLLKMTELCPIYCQCSLEVAPRCTMSALKRFSQSMVRSSYCESKLVSGEAAPCATLGKFRLVCRMVVTTGGAWSG